ALDKKERPSAAPVSSRARKLNMRDSSPTRGRNVSKQSALTVKGGSPEHPSRRPQQTRIGAFDSAAEEPRIASAEARRTRPWKLEDGEVNTKESYGQPRES